MDRLKAMESFVAIVRTGSLTAAAAQTSCSRAALSIHLKQLEHHLGARLFNRTTRLLSLTEAGHTYYEFCIKIVSALNQVDEDLARLQDEPEGSIKIAASAFFANFYLGAAVIKFVNKYKKIQVTLDCKDMTTNPNALLSQGYDCAVYLGLPSDSSAVTSKIGDIRWVPCASDDYLRRHGNPTRPEELRDHCCLVHRTLSPNGLWEFVGPNGPCSVKVSGPFTGNSAIALREGAMAGLGIALLPSIRLRQPIRIGPLRSILSDYQVPARPIHIIFPHKDYLPRKMRLLVEFLKRHLGQMARAPDSMSRELDACEPGLS